MKSQTDKFNLILQSLARSGRHWDEVVPLTLLVDESFGAVDVTSSLFGDMAWQGSMVPVDGRFVLAGAWQMAVPRRCGRCNIEFAAKLEKEVSVSYILAKREHGQEDESDDDLEVMAPPGTLDVLDVLREQFWLAWQPMVVCSPDCKGLCQQCGLNLNDGQCDCHNKREDHPLAALKNFKFDA